MLPYFNYREKLIKSFYGVAHTLDYRNGCRVYTMPERQLESVAIAAERNYNIPL